MIAVPSLFRAQYMKCGMMNLFEERLSLGGSHVLEDFLRTPFVELQDSRTSSTHGSPLLIHMLLGHDERGAHADQLLFINIQNSFIVLSW